jgi:hypothetical protein
MQTKHLKRVLKENKNRRIDIPFILIKSLQGKVLHGFVLPERSSVVRPKLFTTVQYNERAKLCVRFPAAATE